MPLDLVMYLTQDQSHISGGRSHRMMVAFLGVRYFKLCETVSRRNEMGGVKWNGVGGVRSELLVLGGKNTATTSAETWIFSVKFPV